LQSNKQSYPTTRRARIYTHSLSVCLSVCPSLSLTMSTMEAIFTGFIQCINDERWEDLREFISFPLNLNEGNIVNPDAFADRIRNTGRIHIIVDAITLNKHTGYMGATSVSELRLKDKDKGGEGQGQGQGQGVEEKTIMFTEQYILKIEDGKITKLYTIPDEDDHIRRQLADPTYSPTPDLIATHTANANRAPDEKKLSTRELEDLYRAYIACINAQTTARDLPRFCHDEVVHNAKRHDLASYRGLMEEAFAAVPDIVFGIATVVADEDAQRVAARLEFSGTPTGPLAGVKPNGRSVHFSEYVTYSFRDGKIDRVWSIVDWASYRWQLSRY
jgi:predicted ester cyclase